MYHGQFRTRTTNGGKTAHIGGDRFLWEQRLFFDSYPEDSVERPKYGALNLFRYIDGASARFGSCFFSLKTVYVIDALLRMVIVQLIQPRYARLIHS